MWAIDAMALHPFDVCSVFSIMALLGTDAVVLHMSNYLESSRILRLATRDAGVQSVVARGARNSRKRFGNAVDLFAIGFAQIDMRPGRDLHTLTGFDVVRSQPRLAGDLGRFSAASAFAECALRVVHEEAAPAVYEGILQAFGAISDAEGESTVPAALGAFWRLVRDVGFSPSLDACAECHLPIEPDDDSYFSLTAGGVLCRRCAGRAPGGRLLPADARHTIIGWLNNTESELDRRSSRAHQRLFREFLSHHVTDGRPLRAFAEWEAGTFSDLLV